MTGESDLIIAYGDIVYEPRVLAALQAVDAPITLDLSPKISAKSSMRFPLRCNEEISYEEAIHRRTDHQSHQAS